MIGWCHLATFMYKASQFLCQWYLVCLIIDCYVISRPTAANNRSSDSGAHQWSSTCQARLITVTIAVLAIVVFLNISLTAKVLYVGLHPVCTTLSSFMPVLFYLGHIDVGLNVLVPCVLVVLCAIRLLLGEQGSGVGCNSQNSRGVQQDRQNSYLIYCILHSLIWLPLQLIRIVNTVTVLVSRAAHVTLRAFSMGANINVFKLYKYEPQYHICFAGSSCSPWICAE